MTQSVKSKAFSLRQVGLNGIRLDKISKPYSSLKEKFVDFFCCDVGKDAQGCSLSDGGQRAPSWPQTCSDLGLSTMPGPFFGSLDVILLRPALMSEERDTCLVSCVPHLNSHLGVLFGPVIYFC